MLPLIGGLATLGISYLSGANDRSAAQAAAKAVAITRKGVGTRAKQMQIAEASAGKPRTFRSEGPSGSPAIPSAASDVIPGFGSSYGSRIPGTGFAETTSSNGKCPGLTSVPIMGRCVNLGDLAPGGDPAVTGQVEPGVSIPGSFDGTADGYGSVVSGWYGEGRLPRVESRKVRQCPPRYVLGKDGVCYRGLARTYREHNPGMRPLLTGGERHAISVAASAGRKLDRAKKGLKKASRALEKAC